MLDPLFSVEAIDAAVDYQKRLDEAMEEAMLDDADFYIRELDKANKKVDQLYGFIEFLEALTMDSNTSERIRTFLEKEGIWESQQKN
jgi:hypothetical protein